MARHPAPADRAHRGVLTALRRDVRGNTLAMMAIALIPVSALAGSAIDAARLYVVKVRLQQACDAGVLAGRKFMTSSNATTLDTTATTQAGKFFSNNFTNGWMRTKPATFTPVKTTDQQVSGTASVVVPMTIMKMFKASDVTLNVSCEARYDVADTDVVFVLDTTGSMACLPTDNDATCNSYVSAHPATAYTRPASDADATNGYLGSTAYSVPENTSGAGSRIQALRTAVLGFWQTMADNVDPSTHVRYGFVTYTSTVNAGAAIMSASPSYIVGGLANETWKYQSRVVTADYQISVDANPTYNAKTYANCPTTTLSRTPAAALTYNTSNGQATKVNQQWYSGPGKCGTVNQTVGPQWTYGQYDQNISAYVSGNTVNDPTNVNGTTTAWDGCIEERATEAGVTTFTSSSKDLDPDLIPTSDATTRWKPMWADVVYRPYYTTTNGDNSNNYNLGADTYRRAGYVSCGKPIHRLSTMTKSQVDAYVNAVDFAPLGGTYHDTGMIWGTRMLSPTGIFGSDTGAWPGRNTPKRVIVFLTDGDMAPNVNIYGLYGYENYDKRVTGGDFSNITSYHNARFLAECAKARAMQIDVWTVAIDSASSTQLQQCAGSTDKALFTTTGAGLTTAFQTIAQKIAMLRISK